MKFTAVALVASASALDLSSEHMPAFMKFIGDHGKSYATQEEFAFRFAIFQKKVIEHKRWNEMPGQTSTQGVNLFTASSDEEMKAMLGFNPELKETNEIENLSAEEIAAATPVDWRQKGAVTPVKNQGSCGSCWAFSTTGCLEGAHYIASGKLVSLSEAQLINCSSKNSGCNGGLMDLAFTYAEVNPIMPDADWPYVPKTQWLSCYEKYRKSKGIVTVKTFKDVPKSTPAALLASISLGPTSVAIEADQAAFQQYTGGILSSGCGDALDHGVLAVGWGNESGTDYIIVKNSWGPNWGLSGFIKLASQDGPGVCGINQSASRATTN